MWRISTHALTEGDGCIDRRRKVHEISTHALTEGDHLDVPWRPSDIISTHALTEGDELCDPMTAALGNFNSRPHGGRRNLSAHLFFFFIFQLTPSRRATVYVTHWPPCILYFNSRPHGGRLIWICLLNYSFVFQLTPSRRATIFLPYIQPVPSHFNSRPHGGRLWEVKRMYNRLKISTHALTEGDIGSFKRCAAVSDFNSRPHGGRRNRSIVIFFFILFQLTPSRRATILLIC